VDGDLEDRNEEGRFVNGAVEDPKEKGRFVDGDVEDPKEEGCFVDGDVEVPKEKGCFVDGDVEGPKEKGRFIDGDVEDPKEKVRFVDGDADSKEKGCFIDGDVDPIDIKDAGARASPKDKRGFVDGSPEEGNCLAVEENEELRAVLARDTKRPPVGAGAVDLQARPWLVIDGDCESPGAVGAPGGSVLAVDGGGVVGTGALKAKEEEEEVGS
jgi:hypothetical protein